MHGRLESLAVLDELFECVGELLGGGESILHTGTKGLRDHEVQRLRKLRGTGRDGFHELTPELQGREERRSHGWEGNIPGSSRPENGADRMQVRTQADVDSVHLLGTGVVEGPCESARGQGLGHVAATVLGQDPQPEVGNLDSQLPILFGHEDVGGLEVPMHEIVRMHDLQGTQQGDTELGYVERLEEFATSQPSLEGWPWDEFHGEVQVVTGVVPQNSHEVPGPADQGGRGYLPLEDSRKKLATLRAGPLLDDLDGELLFATGLVYMPCAKHRPHATPTERLEELVAVEKTVGK
jgi:hypothetical protein